MADSSLGLAIEELLDRVLTLDGIRNAPDEPPEKASAFPFVVAYPGTGLFTDGPLPLKKGLHNITLEVHVARLDLPRDYRRLVDYGETVPNAIWLGLRNSVYTQFTTIASLSYVLQPSSWGGIDTLAYVFTVNDLKIENEVA